MHKHQIEDHHSNKVHRPRWPKSHGCIIIDNHSLRIKLRVSFWILGVGIHFFLSPHLIVTFNSPVITISSVFEQLRIASPSVQWLLVLLLLSFLLVLLDACPLTNCETVCGTALLLVVSGHFVKLCKSGLRMDRERACCSSRASLLVYSNL